MTINATQTLTGHSDSSASSFTTASMALNPGYLYVLSVGANGTSIPDPTIAQTGVTWAEQVTETASSNRITTFFTIVPATVTNTATINFSSNANNAYWQIAQLGNVLLSGGVAGASIQNTKGTGSGSTTAALSFSGAPASANGGYAAIFLDNTAFFSSRGGINDELANDVGARRLESAYAANGLVQSNCATWNWSGGEQYVAVAFEITFYSGSNFIGLL